MAATLGAAPCCGRAAECAAKGVLPAARFGASRLPEPRRACLRRGSAAATRSVRVVTAAAAAVWPAGAKLTGTPRQPGARLIGLFPALLALPRPCTALRGTGAGERRWAALPCDRTRCQTERPRTACPCARSAQCAAPAALRATRLRCRCHRGQSARLAWRLPVGPIHTRASSPFNCVVDAPRPVHVARAGVGSAVPKMVLTNAGLSKLVDTNDEWIAARTGATPA
jgi:hypothetical protein